LKVLPKPFRIRLPAVKHRFATKEKSGYKSPVQPEQKLTACCPNCGHPVEEQPIDCSVCGYCSESAGEYFWLYLGGLALTILGIISVIAGTLAEGAGPGHWSLVSVGWFPLGDWAADWNWFAYILLGIMLTLVGMGFTRHFRSSLFWGIALFSWQIFCSGKKLLWDQATNENILLPISALVLEVLLLLMVIRLGLALSRTPQRDILRLQAGPRNNEN